MTGAPGTHASAQPELTAPYYMHGQSPVGRTELFQSDRRVSGQWVARPMKPARCRSTMASIHCMAHQVSINSNRSDGGLGRSARSVVRRNQLLAAIVPVLQQPDQMRHAGIVLRVTDGVVRPAGARFDQLGDQVRLDGVDASYSMHSCAPRPAIYIRDTFAIPFATAVGLGGR